MVLFLFPFRKLQYIRHFLAYLSVILPDMGSKAAGTILDAILRIPEAAAAFVRKAIQRAIAEQTAECFRVSTRMTGKILTFPVLKEIIMAHMLLLYPCTSVQGQTWGGSSENSIRFPVAGCVNPSR